MRDSVVDRRCSFCGETDRGPVVEGGGKAAEDLPLVWICLECATACVDALRTEKRFESARSSESSERPGNETEAELGTIVDWTPLELDQVPLEWRAERLPGVSIQRIRSLALKPSGGHLMSAILEDDVVPSDQIAAYILQSRHAVYPHMPQAVAPGEWNRFELDGELVEWRTEQVELIRVGIEVQVQIRNPRTGCGSGMTLPGARRPTVEDAVVLAELDERTVVDEVDPEIDRVVDELRPSDEEPKP